MEFYLISNGHIDTVCSSTKITLEIPHAMFGLGRSSREVITQQVPPRYLDQLLAGGTC